MGGVDSRQLRIGIPKGSLQQATLELFDRAGYNISTSERSYQPRIDDPQLACVMFRSQEMSRYVEDGVIDIGIAGYDWIVENGSDVHEVCELNYSKATSGGVRWVLAVPEESTCRQPADLAGGIVATELVKTTQRYFQDLGVEVKVEFSWGATEVKARLVDAIVDVTETGSSLRANKLRVVDTLCESSTRLVANRSAWADDWKRQRVEDLVVLLQGAINAQAKVGLKMNVPRSKLDVVLKLLPAEQSPTVNELADAEWVAIEVVVEEKVERDLVPQLSRAGARGICSYGLSKVVP